MHSQRGKADLLLQLALAEFLLLLRPYPRLRTHRALSQRMQMDEGGVGCSNGNAAKC